MGELDRTAPLSASTWQHTKWPLLAADIDGVPMSVGQSLSGFINYRYESRNLRNTQRQQTINRTVA